MAQGQFTKQEADFVHTAANEMFLGLPKSKRMEFLGHLNDIFLFIEAAKRAAPNEEPTEEKK